MSPKHYPHGPPSPTINLKEQQVCEAPTPLLSRPQSSCVATQKVPDLRRVQVWEWNGQNFTRFPQAAGGKRRGRSRAGSCGERPGDGGWGQDQGKEMLVEVNFTRWGAAGTLTHCWWQVKWYNHSEGLLEKIKGKRPCTLWPSNSTPGHLSWRNECNRPPKDTSIYTKLKNRQKSSMMLEVRIVVPVGGEWWLRGATRSLGVARNVLYRDEGSSYTDLHTCNMLDEHTSLDVYWTQI